MTQRQPKKTETVEVRLPFETKQAFMQHCRLEGRTASEAIRRFVDNELQAEAPKRLRLFPSGMRWIGAVILAVLALGAVTAPSLAQTLNPTLNPTQASFERLDRNNDGLLSFEEFRAR